MNKDLLVICPTRGRTQMCQKMIDSFDKTATAQFTDLIFIIDVDDTYIEEYEKIFLTSRHSFFIRSNQRLTELHNAIVKWKKNYKFYSITCDDYIYHTPQWDQILMKKLIDKGGGFAYGDDGFGGQALPTTCIISKEIIQALGWIVLPDLKYLCGDMIWRELGHSLNRLFYVPEVKIEHMTFLAGKSEEDETFKRTNNPETHQKDNKTFRIWKSTEMKNDLERIKRQCEYY